MFLNYRDNKGLTLLELMVVIAISSIIMGAVYEAYDSQTRSYNTQQLTVDMQEGLRVALELMQADLRLAGSDRSKEADAGFRLATPISMTFTMDITGGENDGVDNDGDYLVDEGQNGQDDDGDGLTDEFDETEWYDADTNDAGENITWAMNGTTLQRNGSNVAFNIQLLNLIYLDNDGNVLDDDGAGTVTTSRGQIKSVIITMIGGFDSNRRVIRFTTMDRRRYTNQQGDVLLDFSSAPDDIRKNIVSSQVYCRNMEI